VVEYLIRYYPILYCIW